MLAKRPLAVHRAPHSGVPVSGRHAWLGTLPQFRVCLSGWPRREDKDPASSLSQAGQDANEIVQPQQVAVFAVALLPGQPVVQDLAVREGRGLAKVDEPHAGAMAVVVHKEE